MAVLELIGGPLDGLIHEVAGDWPVPNALGLCPDNDDTVRHWYVTDEKQEKATFHHSEGTGK
jgi:hypothetical protein